MSEDVIDEVIASHAESVQPGAGADTHEDAERLNEADGGEEKEQEQDTPFPKKAVNAITSRDRKIGKLRAQMQSMQAELQKYQQSSQQGNEQPAKAEEVRL